MSAEKHSNNSSNSVKSSNKRKKTSKKRPKTSWIWQYFEETKIRDDDGEEISVIVCQKNSEDTICGTSYVYASGSTGNAINHLRNIHEINKSRKKTKVCFLIKYITILVNI
jgi:hypothetical protein